MASLVQEIWTLRLSFYLCVCVHCSLGSFHIEFIENANKNKKKRNLDSLTLISYFFLYYKYLNSFDWAVKPRTEINTNRLKQAIKNEILHQMEKPNQSSND